LADEVQLDDNGAHNLVAAIPLDLRLEDYRERLTPLAHAVLQGEARRTAEKRREFVIPDVWDERLRSTVAKDLARLRLLLDAAEIDLARSPTRSRMVHAVVDRILFELLEHNDRNAEAMQELEAELTDEAPDERAAHAAVVARGAGAWTGIPRNEIRAAIVRTARAGAARGLEREDAVDDCARHLARLLATDERRHAAREWVAEVADGHAEALPLLAEELRMLVASPQPTDPAADPIWLQTCFGFVLLEGLEGVNS
jgi:hypothetical protein